MKVIKNFSQIADFNSTMLEIGEMMEMSKPYAGHIVLRTYDKFVKLDDQAHTWSIDTIIIGRKLLPGESITLIQE